MKTVLLFLLLLLLSGCESDNIRACSLACNHEGWTMKSYSMEKGCECEKTP